MRKDDFRALFLKALDAAAANAETRFGHPVPRSFKIELHAPGAEGKIVSFDRALDRLYLGDDRFYRVIDIAIRRLLPRKSVAIVRVSGHPPVSFDQTWEPAKLGPLKQAVGEALEDQGTLAR